MYNNNASRLSSKQLFAQSVNNGTYATVQLGQPFNARILDITATEATVSYDVVGKPRYSVIEITNVTESQIYRFSTTTLIHKFTSLVPFNTYKVSITSIYACDDSFTLSTPISFTTINEAPVASDGFFVLFPTNQRYGFEPNESSNTYLDVSFNSSIGNPMRYIVEISGVSTSGNILANSTNYYRFENLTRNTQYTLFISTFYSTNRYESVRKVITSLNETSVSKIDVVDRKGNFVDISFTRGTSEHAKYVVYKNGSITDISFSYFDTIKRIPSLNPDISYNFQLATYYTATQNTYLSDVSINVRTANENTITNITATVGVFDVSFSFVASPGIVLNCIANILKGNEVIDSSSVNVASTTYYKNDLSMNSEYVLSFSTSYGDISYNTNYPFKTLYEGNATISSATILGTSATINWSPFSNGAIASQPSFYSVYLDENLKTSTVGNTITLTDLTPSTNYNVYIKSTYNSSNQYRSTSDINFTTLNEEPIKDVLFSLVSGNQIKIIVDTSNSFLSTPSYELTVNGNSQMIYQMIYPGKNTYTIPNLTHNTLYNVTLKTSFANNSYIYETSVRTKNERSIDLSDNDFTITGNTITMVVNPSRNTPFPNYFITCTSTTEYISTNGLSWSFNNLKPNTTHNITIIANSDVSYVSTYTKTTLNESAVGNVKGNVFNNKAEIYFSDSSGTRVEYDISINPPITTVPTILSKEITLSDLSINTSYSVTISSHYSINKYYKIISFRTLNQEKPTDIALRASGSKISIDMFIQNVNDVSSLSIRLLDTSINSLEIVNFSASSLPLDLDINQGHLYTGNVYCIYKESNDSGDISYNKNNIYISDDFFFNSSGFQPTSILTNGVFNIIPNQVEEERGFYRTTPTNWNNSIFVYTIRNSRSNLVKIFYKQNPYNSVSYHAIIYRSTNSTNAGYLQQDLFGYLYSGNYVITFYVSNIFEQGLQFDNVGGVTSSNSEFQIAITNSGTESIYKSGFIVVDISWNKIQLKINIDKSTKNNKFYINRTKLENNSLCISDISMTSVLSFSKETTWTPDVSWSIPDVSGKWNTVGLNPHTPVLISNMSISFWLYIHDVFFFLSKQFLFLIGDSIEAKMSIYFDSSINLLTETIRYQLSQKIPIHITIIYSNQNVTIYMNGKLLSVVPGTQLTEPLGSDTFYLSKTCLGYIIKQFKIFDYPLPLSEILNFVQNEKINIGNLSDISSNRQIVSFIPANSTDISYQLFDTTNFLVKKLFYFSTAQLISVNASNNLTCAFWIQTTANISLVRIFDFSFCHCEISNYQLYFNEEIIFTMLPDKWYHLTWTLSNAASRFYLNGYLYKQLATVHVTNIDGVVGNSSVNMGDFKLYNLFASESNVLTLFHSHYSLESLEPESDSLRNLSTNYVYTINLNIPDGGTLKNTANENVDLSYNVNINNETFIYGAFTNDASTSQISIDSIRLNHYRQSSPNLTVNLSQLGISKTYSISGPYISFSTENINEGQTVTIKLNNPPVSPNLFTYTISGANIDESDFSGNDLTGNISTDLILNIRNDFKNENNETFTFSIPSLKISKTGIITNTSNSLTFSSTSISVKKDETIAISLDIPSTAMGVIFYYSISGISDEDILIDEQSINSEFTNKSFTYNSSSILVKVTTPLSKTLTLTLTEYNHILQKIRLNDVAKASLNLFDLVRSYFYEGETIKININVPFSKSKGFEYRYVITGTIASSDLSGVDMSGNIKIEGQGEIVTFQIPINNDFRTEGSETLIFSLYDGENVDASLNFDILDSSIASSYILSSDKTTVNEGESFTIYLNTVGVPPNIDVSYIISGVESSDIIFVPLSGNFTTTVSGVVSKTFFISNDSLTDGIDTFRITLIGIGVNVYTEVTIVDTSLKPTYTFYRSPANYILDETPLSLWLLTNNAVPKNTIIPYTITGISSEDISGITLQGNILTTQISKENNLIIQRLTDYYKTMLISADGYDISSVKIGLNYSTSNPKSTIGVIRDESFVYINSSWYGYNNTIIFSISGDVSGSFTVDEFEQSYQQKTTAMSGSYRFYQRNSVVDICNGSYNFS